MTKTKYRLAISSMFTILWYIWWAITLIYIAMVLLPTNIFLQVQSFSVDDTTVWSTTNMHSRRNASIDLWWFVVEEINFLSWGVHYPVYGYTRELNIEKTQKTIQKEIKYIHTKPWQYELYLILHHDLGFGIWKITRLHSFYTVR